MDISKYTKIARKALKLRYCGAVIVAAGSASRMGGIDKVMAPLSGEPMIVHTVRAFQNCDAMKEIVIVTRQDLLVPVMDLCRDFDKVTAVILGGGSRQESVCNGLYALSEKVQLVAVQDGARPLITWQVIDRTVRAANSYGAAAPAVPVKDTIKVVKGGLISETPDRSTLRAVQTPQVFDLDLLREISRGLEEIGNAHADTRSSFRGVSPDVFKHQIPGGMLSNMESQLRSMNALDRIDEVFKECEIVRHDLGYPPLATPFSQMVGAQATTNVLTGKRYGMLSKENVDYVAGMYGRAPGPVSRELEKMVLGDEPPQQARPGSLLEPGWEKAVEESREFARCEEDVMTYALFPNVAEPFLRRKYGLEEKA